VSVTKEQHSTDTESEDQYGVKGEKPEE